MKIGWSDSEELLCVEENGDVTIFDLFGNFKHKFSMGIEAKNTKIIDARIYPSVSETGIAVMTSKFRIFVVSSIVDQKIKQLPEIDCKFRKFKVICYNNYLPFQHQQHGKF